jgi:hypothetical protein
MHWWTWKWGKIAHWNEFAIRGEGKISILFIYVNAHMRFKNNLGTCQRLRYYFVLKKTYKLFLIKYFLKS